MEIQLFVLQYSWLHHAEHATVMEVKVQPKGEESTQDTPSDTLEVMAILSEANIGKFRAKFGKSVSVEANQ